jgi:outer membrane biosynthesis protein TonB
LTDAPLTLDEPPQEVPTVLRRLFGCAFTGVALAAALLGTALALGTAVLAGTAAHALPPDPTPPPTPDPEPTQQPDPDPEPTNLPPLPTLGPTPTTAPEPTSEPTVAPTSAPTAQATSKPEPRRTRITSGRADSSSDDVGGPEVPRGFALDDVQPSAGARPLVTAANNGSDDPVLRFVQAGVALALVLGLAGIGGLYLTRHDRPGV